MAPRKTKRAGSPSKATGRASKKAASKKKPELEENPRNIFLRALGVPTSHRKHKSEFKLSMSSLHDNSIDEKYIETLSQSLGISSFQTWGKTNAKPITATTRKTRPFNVRRRAPASSQASFSSLFPSYNAPSTPQPIIPNSPSRSPLLLGLPLEIRERVYGYFLLFPKPILLKPNLSTIESLPPPPNKSKHPTALLYICKQISHESTSYLYRSNTFTALFRSAPIKPRHFRLHDDDDVDDLLTSGIAPRFLHLFRNVIIDLPKENWDLTWYERASDCVEKLVLAGGVPKCVTMVMAPQKVGMSEMATGMVAEPVTFADFLWGEGRVVNGLRVLGKKGCAVLNVVVRLKGRRYLISVDLRDLREDVEGEEVGLRNEESVKVLERRKGVVETQLTGLKERFELVFEYEERALSEGLCRVLGPEESLMDGVKLAERN